MEIAVAEDLAENLLGEDVLDQHLANVGGGDVGVDRLLRVLEELDRGVAKIGIPPSPPSRSSTAGASRTAGRSVLNWDTARAELGDLLALVRKKRPRSFSRSIGLSTPQRITS